MSADPVPPPIAPVATAVTAFVGRTAEGPVDARIDVHSVAEFEGMFGSLSPLSTLGYAVRHFFDNGGRHAVVVRVAPPGGDDSLTGAVHECVEAAAREVLGDASNRTGLHALHEAGLFNLLVIPPLVFERRAPDGTVERIEADVPLHVWSAAAQVCAARRALLLVDAPRDWTVAAAVTGVRRFAALERKNAALYFPFVMIPDPLDGWQPKPFAPSGAVAGVMARTDETRGVWKAPAGRDAVIVNASGLSIAGQPANLIDGANALLNPRAVNCLRRFPGRGCLVWGARTLDGDDTFGSEWKYVPARRLALFIEESVHRGTTWTVFEPNAEPLWATVRQSVGAFLHELFRQGAFAGARPQEAYLVKCGADTMTPADIEAGRLHLHVGIATVRPAEFVVIRIQLAARPPDD